MHSLLQDLEFIVELCKQGALAERSRDEASLQLVSDVVTSCDLLLGVSWLGQQLDEHKHTWTSEEDKQYTSACAIKVNERVENSLPCTV